MNPHDNATTATEHLVGGHGLDRGDFLRIEQPREVLVYVAQGRVWITEEGGQDVVIGAGEWHRLQRPGVALVEAWKPAVLLLTSPHETGAWSRLDVCAPEAAPAVAQAKRPHRAWRGIRVAARIAARQIGSWLRPMSYSLFSRQL